MSADWKTDNRYVWIDPARRSGTPCVGGTRLSAEIVAEYVWAGTSVAEVAHEYDITVPQVLVACWYMAVYGTRTWRKRWGAWAKEAHPYLWDREKQSGCPMPPAERAAALRRGESER